MTTRFALLLCLWVSSPAAADSSALGLDPDPPTKKALYLAEKRKPAPTYRLIPPQSAMPAINIHNRWTLETVAIDVKPARAAGADVSREVAARFFRCHFTNQVAPEFDPRLFALVVKAARHFKSARVEIVSGYRAPKYNLMLRKKGRNVARDSQHAVGHAVDFRLDGVPTQTLLRWVRTQRLGGVGYYPSSRFVHADTGPRRFWLGE
jgi:uncharacterized protein YcbK (DUF882 family)